MELADTDLWQILEKNLVSWSERKRLLLELYDGYKYLEQVGIHHYDLKLTNILLKNGRIKICDFGLVWDQTGRESYRQMGYSRRGGRYKRQKGFGLQAGTPGFCVGSQLFQGNNTSDTLSRLIIFLICEWKSAWKLLFNSIDEDERKIIEFTLMDGTRKGPKIQAFRRLRMNFTKEFGNSKVDHKFVLAAVEKMQDIVTIPANTCESLGVNVIRQVLSQKSDEQFKYLSKNVVNQKDSQLCVFLSLASLFRHAIKCFLEEQGETPLDESDGFFTFESVFLVMTMILLPRNLAGLELRNNQTAQKFYAQQANIVHVLKRLTHPTFFEREGWKIIARQCWLNSKTRIFSKANMNRIKLCSEERFLHEVKMDACSWRPLAVIGAYLKTNCGVHFHQMVLDHIDVTNDEYVLKNTQHNCQGVVTKVPLTRSLYVRLEYITDLHARTGSTRIEGTQRSVVNESFNIPALPKMKEETWYLLPHAYSLHFEYLDELALSYQRKIDSII